MNALLLSILMKHSAYRHEPVKKTILEVHRQSTEHQNRDGGFSNWIHNQEVLEKLWATANRSAS